MNKIKIYTDGSCDNNGNKIGGYAAILIYEGQEPIELLGKELNSTNNRMELMGPIAAIESLVEPHEIEIYSDSAYVVNCFKQHWYEKWIENGWRNWKGNPVENKDLWIRLMKSFKNHKISFIKVKGHSDDELNNRCDELAKKATCL